MPSKPAEYDERGEPKVQPKEEEQAGSFDPRFPPEGGWGEPESA